ncbi:MAG: protein kinase [archaeon]|nr:protein kinase [archaeon]
MAASSSQRKHIGPDDFTILRCIGKGDVGSVYLVTLTGSDPQAHFAMKVLNKVEMQKRNKIRRVFTEREVLATSQHPLIVQLHYTFQNKENIFFVMDFCAGGQLYHLLKFQPSKQIPESAVKFYASEVLLGLEYLHFLGFIYRDLKPENILLDGSGHVKLSDFDLSKTGPVTLGEGASVCIEPKFLTDSLVGTVEYMAPEVVGGRGHSGSVDWWTFGILIYEMLYGKTPFCGESDRETFEKIERARLRFPAQPKVSRDTKRLLRALLTHDPAKRLGAQNGAEEIKAHPWFHDVKFGCVLNQTPPLIPRLRSPTDTRYFKKIRKTAFDRESLSSPSISGRQLERHDVFRQFHEVVRGPGSAIMMDLSSTGDAPEPLASNGDAATSVSFADGDVIKIPSPTISPVPTTPSPPTSSHTSSKRSSQKKPPHRRRRRPRPGEACTSCQIDPHTSKSARCSRRHIAKDGKSSAKPRPTHRDSRALISQPVPKHQSRHRTTTKPHLGAPSGVVL